ncbi:hypothetical protein [Caldilinea sp.]|uniref:hypothetical protein n=1 Tax=Caldilinea sp. TaxID=2293560 RepID=UPI002B7F8E74|nr:hypothetical protein [Anaerolineales bacterium]HQY93401.1 hypothetical protein [Caldilinea sp.]
MIKTVIEDGYRIALPETVRGQFHIGDEVVVNQESDGRIVIEVAESNSAISYQDSGKDSPLGIQLRELRKRIVSSGTPLLNWGELEQDLAERRGEH